MRRTQTYISAVIALFCFLLIQGCHTTEGDADLPKDAKNFIYRYFPLNYVESEEELSSGDFKVVISGGPTIIFDQTGSWTDINGNGGTIPQLIAFNDFPKTLYNYIESLEQTNAIYSVSRTDTKYNVLLFDIKLTYIITSDQVTED